MAAVEGLRAATEAGVVFRPARGAANLYFFDSDIRHPCDTHTDLLIHPDFTIVGTDAITSATGGAPALLDYDVSLQFSVGGR
ncbi:MAG: hypothetical protein ACREMS_01605 [Gemmatimonadaceae bacterium]